MHPAPPPIACTLSATDRPAHAAAIRALGARGHARVDGTEVRLRDEPGVARELEQILTVERACCPFFDLQVTRKDGDLMLRIGAPAKADALARELAQAFVTPG
jgi:hypothetical protein